MRRNESGFGLILLVALIAISGILTTSTALYFRSAAREVQSKIDLVRAQYAADAGIMEAIYRWHTSHTDDTLRSYAHNTPSTLPILYGNVRYVANPMMSNFAYFNLSGANGAENQTFWGENGWTGAPVSCLSRRYQGWTVKNINNNAVIQAGQPNTVRFKTVRVDWTAPAGNTARLVDIRLGGVSVIGEWCQDDWGSGIEGCPSGRVYQGLGGIPYPTLDPGTQLDPATTYLEWNNPAAAQQITSVAVFLNFWDNGTSRDTGGAQLTFWGPGATPPQQRTFVMNAQGNVDGRGSDNTLRDVKAALSGNTDTPGDVEVMDWDYDKIFWV